MQCLFMSDAPELSIIIPLYNETENLNPLYLELMPSLDEINRSVEVIFVDDGNLN
jgi:cellulose synthase/poly-beta-1,6-N-acetylglucosamine synthase-like glycosyltransferase